MTGVLGRNAELARGAEFLDAIRSRFGVLVFEGEAGIGKTVVLDEVVGRAKQEGVLVLACRASQAEAKLALSAVADLMEQVPGSAFDGLPAPQRRALEVALLRADPGDERITDRALAAAVRSVLAGLSATRPVVIAIDDAHWLDAASAAVLGYALRRLDRVPLGLLATRRAGEPERLKLRELVPAEELHRVAITPLSLGAVHHLIRQHYGKALARHTLLRIHEASRGNPLYALEMGRLLAELGPIGPGQPLPTPSDVESLVRTRVLRLPSRAREVLFTAAGLAEARASLVSAAAGREIDDDLVLAETRGIASVDRGVIRFQHPLLGSAIYASMTDGRRRELHRGLATVVTDPEERARHLALAANGPDEATARVVHASAREASARGAPTAAVELLEYAIAIGEPDETAKGERTYELAESLSVVGDNARARELLDAVDPWHGWPPTIHGDALDLMLELEYWLNGPGPELDRLGERLLAHDLPPAVRAQVHASLAQYMEHDLPAALEHAEAALRLLGTMGSAADPFVHATALAFRARNRLVLGGGLDREASDLVAALEGKAGASDRRRLAPAADGFGQWLKYADDVDGARALLEAGLTRDLDSGHEKGALNKFQHLALTECLAGNFEVARQHAMRACELYDQESNNVLGYAQAIRAIVEAHRGDADAVFAVRDMYAGQRHPIHLEVALGLLELSLGHHQEASAHLTQVLDASERAGLREPGIHRAHANAAEAAVALGDLVRARSIVSQLEEHGRRATHRWSLAAGARCRALVLAADGDIAGGLLALDEAMGWHERLPMPFERARTLLVKGIIERRSRRRSQSRASLQEAAGEFQRMGARLWAARAEAELSRLGLRRSSGDQLTEGERRCAELAATGKTNREIAEAMFISLKTVEANLSRAYAKVGVRSRAELAARLAPHGIGGARLDPGGMARDRSMISRPANSR